MPLIAGNIVYKGEVNEDKERGIKLLNSRADYWKSQGRKFCDFCKCWIADNKPSIDFHEGGKKHKENVSKRLKEIHKNSAKQAKQNKKIEDDIKRMENVRSFYFFRQTLRARLKKLKKKKEKTNAVLLNECVKHDCFPYLGSYGCVPEGCREQHERHDRGENHQREIEPDRNERRGYTISPAVNLVNRLRVSFYRKY